MEIILLLVRLFLFGVFVFAGIGKLLDLEGSEKAVKGFGIPEPLAKPVSRFLPVVEIVIGVLLLFVGTAWIGAVLAFLLLLVFIGGMAVQLAQGNAPDCHCFGQIHSEPVGKSSLIRNIVFAILSLLLIWQGPTNQGYDLSASSTDMLQAVLILGILVLVAVAVFYLKKIFEQQLQITRRIEVLELVSRDGAHVEREDVGSPTESLPLGAPFPEFELADTGGKRVRFSDYRKAREPILFLFVSPDCGPCNALFPEIQEWRKDHADKFKIVLVSSGSISANIEKFGEEFGVLLQEKRELAEQVKARWTPTAIYVNADGKIASHPAAGDTAIRELVEKLHTEDLAKEHLYFSADGNGSKVLIGEKVPEFSMEALNGQTITHEAFQGKESLVVFFSMTCPHCVRMIEELKEWDLTKGADEPNLIVFSDGDAEAHEELDLSAPIILDKDHKVSAQIGMRGTPSGVLVNEKGEIVTETGVGAPNIWALIGKERPSK
ncbi:MAG TPA: MauE/DoxX family redox-associated membrane protein [Pyrinomonadaceae bacterium]|nr:MauE/DoxX family redox-associated membrane protein [Pyrinomonadaceae bacterium]